MEYINKQGYLVTRLAKVDAHKPDTGRLQLETCNTDAEARRLKRSFKANGWDVYAYKVELNVITGFSEDIGEIF